MIYSEKSPMSVHASSGTSYVRLSDVFNHNAAIGLHTGGMGGDVIHLLQGGMNHMALIGIHWLTTLQFTSIRRLLLIVGTLLPYLLNLQFTSIRRLLLTRLWLEAVPGILQFTSIRRLLLYYVRSDTTTISLQFTSIRRLLLQYLVFSKCTQHYL